VTILRRQAPIDRFFIDLDLARRGRYLLGCSPPLGLARSGRSEGSAVVGTLSIGTIRAAGGVSSTGNGAFALELLNAPQEFRDQSITLVQCLLKITSLVSGEAASRARSGAAEALDTAASNGKCGAPYSLTKLNIARSNASPSSAKRQKATPVAVLWSLASWPT
jgi:hypothetical protein